MIFMARVDVRRLRHRFLLPVVSRIVPDRALRFLHRHWPVEDDPSTGWSFWIDASYARYVRRDMRGKIDA